MPVGARRWRKPCAWERKCSTRSSGALKAAGTTRTWATKEASHRTCLREAALDFVMQSIEKAGYKPGDDLVLALRLRRHRILQGRRLRLRGRGPEAVAGPAGRISLRSSSTPIRSSPSRTDGGGRLGGLESPDRPHRVEMPARRRRSFRDERHPPVGVHQARSRQFDPREGEPDRLADRDPLGGRNGSPRRLHGRNVPSLRWKRRIRPSQTSRWRRTAGRSRPAHSPAPTGWRSTTSSSASSRNWAPSPFYAGRGRAEGAEIGVRSSR